MRFREVMDGVFADCSYAARSLSRQPVLAAAAVLCLAIGLAANAVMFDAVDTLLLHPPAGVADARSLLWITAERRVPKQGFTEYPGVSYSDYIDMANLPELSDAAAYFPSERSVGAGLDVQQVNTLTITATFMPLLHATPALGRFFTASEDSVNAPNLIVLGHAFWQRQFGGSPTVLGQTVRVGTELYVVIGVAPRDFNGLERTRVDAYFPISIGPLDRFGRRRTNMAELFGDRQYAWLRVIARPRPATARASLEAKLKGTYSSFDHAEPFLGDTLKLVVATPMALVAMPNPQKAQDATVSVWLNAVAVIVLLIACANVAGLLLTRALRRRHEIALRLALGISRARLVRLLLLEGIVLVVAGGALALALGWFGAGILHSTLLSSVDVTHNFFNARVLGVSFAAMAVTGLVTGLAPALASAKIDLAGTMRTASRDSVVQHGRMHTTLLIAQIALALVLAVGAVQFTQSYRNLIALDLGFDAEHVLRVRANPISIGYTPARAMQFSREVAERVRQLPGVTRVALAGGGPFAGEAGAPIWISGQAIPADISGTFPEFARVSPEFFETLGMKLRRGRLIVSSDGVGAPLVTVINEEMSRRYWPAGDAIGKCIRIMRDSAPCTTVIGIVETARQGNGVFQPIQYERPVGRYYLPIAQDTVQGGAPMLYVRSTSDAARVVPLVRRTISEVEPQLPYPDVTAFSTALAPQFRPWRLGALMFTLFGGIALVLAAIGLYGVLAFRISQRTHEIGIRMALGAQQRDVLHLVIGQGLRLAASGLCIGILLSLAISRTANSLLYGVSATDPLTLAVACAVIVMIALLASYVPARRATSVDPLSALREL